MAKAPTLAGRAMLAVAGADARLGPGVLHRRAQEAADGEKRSVILHIARLP